MEGALEMVLVYDFGVYTLDAPASFWGTIVIVDFVCDATS